MRGVVDLLSEDALYPAYRTALNFTGSEIVEAYVRAGIGGKCFEKIFIAPIVLIVE
jgi:hypothetical protein